LSHAQAVGLEPNRTAHARTQEQSCQALESEGWIGGKGASLCRDRPGWPIAIKAKCRNKGVKVFKAKHGQVARVLPRVAVMAPRHKKQNAGTKPSRSLKRSMGRWQGCFPVSRSWPHATKAKCRNKAVKVLKAKHGQVARALPRVAVMAQCHQSKMQEQSRQVIENRGWVCRRGVSPCWLCPRWPMP